MAYSYMALEIFRLARARGWRTVLGQIDAGPPEERIVASLHDSGGAHCLALERPPAQYWSDWHEECALADRIVVNSTWAQAALEQEGVPAAKTRVVPLAYDGPQTDRVLRKQYPAQFTRSRPLRVLFLGKLNLRKGAGPFFEAIELLREEPIEFWLVGPVQVSVPADLRHHPRVRWFGRVSRADTAPFYREADLFILPTFSDGFALTQLEAQSWKLPVIATKFCGEVVQDNDNGLLLPEVSAGAIAAALRRCLADTASLQKLAMRSGLSERFSLRQVGDQWMHVFD
jgi:glycosyltransferase involved in cell wall biosynthesis